MNALDGASPIPLYAQLAESVRYEIATGKIEAGSLLPALRAGAKRWGVNLHTVRRAYAVLAEKGLVRTDPQRGTVVLGRGVGGAGVDPVDWFISRTVTEAYERHGLSVNELILRLDRWGNGSGVTGEQPVFVVEEREGEASAYAVQLRSRWAVAAEGWSLERPGMPPAGLIIVPIQRYNDVRARWPDRYGDVHFLATIPDPSIAARVMTAPRKIVRAVVCETELPAAKRVASELRQCLPAGRVEVVPHVVSRPGELLGFVPESIDAVLLPPRMWDELAAAERAHPKAIEIRYVFDASALGRLAEDLAWPAR